ncbi:hypothetical protein KIPB_013562, partial [Kipferlia bialata]
ALHLVKDHHSTKNMGYGYFEFDNPALTSLVVSSLHGSVIKGCRLTCYLAALADQSAVPTHPSNVTKELQPFMDDIPAPTEEADTASLQAVLPVEEASTTIVLLNALTA